MKTGFRIDAGRLFAILCASSIFVLVSAARNFRLARGILDDPFHQGEYFASFTSIFREPAQSGLLVIHGALDYLPALAVRRLTDAGHYFLGTWFAYKLSTFCAGLLLLALAWRLMDAMPGRRLWLVAAAVAAPMTAGYRDLMLLAALALYFQAQRPGPACRRIAAQAGLGATLAFGLFWSFDRGLAGLLAIGAGMAVSALTRPPGRASFPAVPVAVFAAGLTAGHFLVPVFSLTHYLDNLVFLMRTSAQWRHPWNGSTIAVVAVLVVANLGALAVLWSVAARRTNRAHLADAVVLSVTALVVLRACTNRADIQHVFWGLWPPLLVLACRYGRYGHRERPRIAERRVERPAPLATGAVAIAAAAVVLVCGLRGDYRWVAFVGRSPDNGALVAEPVRWAGDRLRRAGVTCVLDMSNHGLINGLVDAPACSRFSYPVYASGGDGESELIEAVETRKPAAVVYSSTHWAYRVDGRSMKERFPSLDRYLLLNYPKEECNSAYCLRFSATRP